MQGLLKIAKDFRPSTEGRHLTDGKILFRLSESADPAAVSALFDSEFGRPTETKCLELLPTTLTGTLAVPIVDTKIVVLESKAVRKGRKTTYETLEFGIFKATNPDQSHTFTFFDLALVRKAVSMVKAHYGPFQADSIMFFQDPESGKIIGTIWDSIPVFVAMPISNMLERLKDKVSFSGSEIVEILEERMGNA